MPQIDIRLRAVPDVGSFSNFSFIEICWVHFYFTAGTLLIYLVQSDSQKSRWSSIKPLEWKFIFLTEHKSRREKASIVFNFLSAHCFCISVILCTLLQELVVHVSPVKHVLCVVSCIVSVHGALRHSFAFLKLGRVLWTFHGYFKLLYTRMSPFIIK